MAYRGRAPRSLLMICLLPLVMTACANPNTESAATQWSFNGTQYAESTPENSYSAYENGPAEAAPASENKGDAHAAVAQAGEDDWAGKTYVYRGGRDPKTGQAVNRM